MDRKEYIKKMKSTIRTAISGDGEILASLNECVHKMHQEEFPDHLKDTTLEEAESWFEERILSDNYKIWIAECDHEPAGYVSAVIAKRKEDAFAYARSWVQVYQIVVLPDCRKRGISRQLIERVVDLARQVGTQELELYCWAFNKSAHAAFEKLGFSAKATNFSLDVNSMSQTPGKPLASANADKPHS